MRSLASGSPVVRMLTKWSNGGQAMLVFRATDVRLSGCSTRFASVSVPRSSNVDLPDLAAEGDQRVFS